MDNFEEDIRNVLPHMLDSSICIRKVQESLQTSLCALQETKDDEKSVFLLRSGIIYLIKVMKLLDKSMPIYLENQILNLLLENIIAVTECGNKSSNFVLPYITGPCLDLLINNAVPFLSKIEVLKTLNIAFEPSTPAVKEDILHKEEVKSKLEHIFQLIIDIGDYEFQVGMTEFLFRLMPRKSRQHYLHQFIKQEDILHACLRIRDSCFEIDCREFLNHLNSCLIANRKVFSYPCQAIAIGSFELHKPSDEGYKYFWVDFNKGSHRITVFCENAPSSTQTSDGENFWDTISIWHKDFISFRCWEEEYGTKACIHLRPSADCFASSETDHNVYITMDTKCNLPTALLQTFTQKKKTSDSVNSLHIVTSDPCLDEPVGHDGMEVLGKLQEAFEEETRRVHTGRSVPRKVSVPSEPMSTPASTISISSLHSKCNILAEQPHQLSKDKQKSRNSTIYKKKARTSLKVLKREPQKVGRTDRDPATFLSEKKKKQEESAKSSVKTNLINTPQRRVTRSSQKVKTPVAIFKEPAAKKQESRKPSKRSKSSNSAPEVTQADTATQLAVGEKCLISGEKENSLLSTVIPDSLPLLSQPVQDHDTTDQRIDGPEHKECEDSKGGQCMQSAETLFRLSPQQPGQKQQISKSSAAAHLETKQRDSTYDLPEQTSSTHQNTSQQACTPVVCTKSGQVKPSSSLDEFKNPNRQKFCSKNCLDKSDLGSVSKKQSNHQDVKNHKSLTFDPAPEAGQSSCSKPALPQLSGKKPKHGPINISKRQKQNTSENQKLPSAVSSNNAKDDQSDFHIKHHEKSSGGRPEVTIGPKTTKVSHDGKVISKQTNSGWLANCFNNSDDEDDNTDFRFNSDNECLSQVDADLQTKDPKPSRSKQLAESCSMPGGWGLKRTSKENLQFNCHNLRKQQAKSYKENGDSFSEEEIPTVSKVSPTNRSSLKSKIPASFRDTKFLFTSAKERLGGHKKKVVKMFAMSLSNLTERGDRETTDPDQDPYDFKEDDIQPSALQSQKSSLSKGENHSDSADSCAHNSHRISRSTKEDKSLKRKLAERDHSHRLTTLSINEKSPCRSTPSGTNSPSPKLFFSQPKKIKTASGFQQKRQSRKNMTGVQSSTKSNRSKTVAGKNNKKGDSASRRKSKPGKDASQNPSGFGDDVVSISNRSELSWIAKHSSKVRDDTRISRTYKRKAGAGAVLPQPRVDQSFKGDIKVAVDVESLECSPPHQTNESKDRGKIIYSPLYATLATPKMPVSVSCVHSGKISRTKKGTPKLQTSSGSIKADRASKSPVTQSLRKKNSHHLSSSMESLTDRVDVISSSERSNSQHSQETVSYGLSQMYSLLSQEMQDNGCSPICSSYDGGDTGKSLLSWKQQNLLSSPACRQDSKTAASTAKHSSKQPAKHRHGSKKSQVFPNPSDAEDKNLSASERGCVSGPSSRIRPSKSEMKRKYLYDWGSELSSSDQSSRSHCLLPRQLFKEDNSVTAKTKTQQQPESIPEAVKGIKTTTQGQARMHLSSAGDGDPSTLASVSFSTETFSSQVDPNPGKDDGDFSLKTVSMMLKGFGSDLQRQMKERESQIHDLAENAWRLSNKRVCNLWLQEKERRDKSVQTFQEAISSDLSSLEKDISALREAETKTLAVYLQQLKVLRRYREKLQNRVKGMKMQHAEFGKETVEATEHSSQAQRSMQTQLKKEMKVLEKKFLLQMQHQQLQNVKKSLQKLF